MSIPMQSADQSAGPKQGEHDIQRTRVKSKVLLDGAGFRFGMRLEPAEEIEMEQGSGNEFGSILAIAKAKQLSRVGFGRLGEPGIYGVIFSHGITGEKCVSVEELLNRQFVLS
jgi:hypothetical protein